MSLFRKTVDLDINGVYKYNQRKGIISPNVTCFPNNMCQAWEIFNQSENCWNNVKNYHTEYPRIADKFIYFCRFEPMIQEIYKFYFPTEYKKWINDSTKDKWLFSTNSNPPNEVFKIICIAFNLFVSMNKGDIYNGYAYIDNITTSQIKEMLDETRPVVLSFKLDNLHHIMTIKGYNSDGFLIYDTYGCNFMNKYQSIGNCKVMPYNDFKKFGKPLNSDKKMCVCFKK